MPEITIPDMGTSAFFPVSNSTPVSTNTDKQMHFEISEPCSDDFIDHNLLVESTNDEESVVLERLEGRRIVDINHLFEQIKKIRHEPFNCSFVDMLFISETRKGYMSVFTFKCKMCNIISKITSEMLNNTAPYLPINKAIVNGSLAIGIGQTQLAELSASIELPFISSTSYISHLSTVSSSVQDTAIDEITKAGKEEREIAIKNRNVDENGIPMCTVIADGQWSKRSYKTKYNSFSGAATIIGFNTKKVLFVGVRNSYCSVCQRATNRKTEPPVHVCFLNWKKPSTAMEADSILEGFSNSLNMHGLKYNKLIGDGDSSVTNKLNEVMPYGPEFKIQKIECRNHLLRNYGMKMSALSKKIEYPAIIRKFITTNILRFRSDITKAIEHHLNENSPLQQKIRDLRKDITNSPYHRLGQHDNCANYFCTGPKVGERNFVPEAIETGIMAEIRKIVYRLAANTESLIENTDNNPCEQFNSLINKHIGGKRINFTQGNNYKTRVEAAVVAYNSHNYIRAVQKTIISKSPGKFGNKYSTNITRIRNNTNNRRRKLFSSGIVRTKPKYKCSAPDNNYGLAEPLDDNLSLNNEHFLEKKNLFLQKLTDVNRYEIEKVTRDQSHSEIWYKERRVRLTASKFGEICKMRDSTSCKIKVHGMLYKPSAMCKSMAYGIEIEPLARSSFEALLQVSVQLCGLFIDREYPYLAASPDGLVGEHFVLEIKCPYAAKDTISAIEAMEKKLLPYCSVKEGKIVLKKDHAYYFQVIGQLRITQRNLCYFVIYTKNWMNVEEIHFDISFWEMKMVKKLQSFYLDCLLPEIIDPLYGKRLLITDIREPLHILNAQHLQRQIKKKNVKR
ncbi:unnamed protein product [Macrosiphum euphorbiae]|uniref:YqaJ viral recombinase domain-containing protein n=1 Tax=Macrosiphum euphorbiae TaxID=13131 RepID=A0AAV0X3S4_9HEMI|nr:unnamed protein product [Macrosiphum euphorbiae]